MVRSPPFRLAAAMAALIGLAAATGVRADPPCPATPAAFAELRQRVLHPRPDHIVVVAHRACFAAAPENSPEAIDACWQMGVEVVENDVRRTKDGHLVIFHDPEISRMTDRWGYVADMTLAELRQARLKERDGSGDGYRDAFVTGSPVTTLEAYLAAAKHRVMINFELKYSGRDDFIAMFEQSVAIARAAGVLDHILFKIPDVRHHGVQGNSSLIEALDIPPDVQVMPIIWESGRQIPDRLGDFRRVRPAGFEIPFQDPAYLDGVAATPALAKTPVMVVAVQPYWSGGLDDRLAARDPDAAWGRLIALGADHVMTDRPEALLRYLAATGRRAARSCRSAR